jgi:hypothetical protein
MVKEKNSKERRKDTDTNEAVTRRENGDCFIGIRGIGRGQLRARRTLLTDSARKKKMWHTMDEEHQVKESEPDRSANVSVRGGTAAPFSSLCALRATRRRLDSRRVAATLAVGFCYNRRKSESPLNKSCESGRSSTNKCVI